MGSVDNFSSRSLHSLVSVEHETGHFKSTRNHLIFCLLFKHHLHLLTKINSTNKLGLRKVNALCTKKFLTSIFKKKKQKKKFIKDYFLNNLAKKFLHDSFMNEKTTSITSPWVASTSGCVNHYNVHLKTTGT